MRPVNVCDGGGLRRGSGCRRILGFKFGSRVAQVLIGFSA
jgi:hypothetical protein